MWKFLLHFFIGHLLQLLMSENHIVFLIFQDSSFFCDGYSCFFCITGYHYDLDTRIVQSLNGLDRIGSYIISQTKDRQKNGLSAFDLGNGQKFHGTFGFSHHLRFHFFLICRGKFFHLTIRKHIMRYFINDILRSTLPVNQAVFQSNSCTFLLGIKTADIFYFVRIIFGIIISIIQCIGEKCTVHVIASDCFSLCGYFGKVVQSDRFNKFCTSHVLYNLTVTCDKLYQRKISLCDGSGFIAEQDVHIRGVGECSFVADQNIFLVHGLCVHRLNQAVHHRKAFRYCHDNDGCHQHNGFCDHKKNRHDRNRLCGTEQSQYDVQNTGDRSSRYT